MHFSRHAQKRMQQRGIRKAEAEFVFSNGWADRAPGGVERLTLSRKELHRWIAYHLDEARRLRRMARVGLVTEGGVVITVQHQFNTP